MFVEGWKLMKSIQFEEASTVCLKGRKTTEEELNRQCVWRGPVSQFGFDYMSKINKQKKEKNLVSGIFRLLIDLRILVKAITCNQL